VEIRTGNAIVYDFVERLARQLRSDIRFDVGNASRVDGESSIDLAQTDTSAADSARLCPFPRRRYSRSLFQSIANRAPHSSMTFECPFRPAMPRSKLARLRRTKQSLGSRGRADFTVMK